MSDLVVRPARFTDNLEGMRLFLETLGMRPRVKSKAGTWLDMVAGGGMVALHSAQNARWCLMTGSASECDFNSMSQCLASKRGNAGLAIDLWRLLQRKQ